MPENNSCLFYGLFIFQLACSSLLLHLSLASTKPNFINKELRLQPAVKTAPSFITTINYRQKGITYLPVNSIERSSAKRHMMPVGIPKVAYRIPGSNYAEWIDIFNRLYRERIIFLSQEIDSEVANQIIGIMLYLDCEENTKPIYLYINSPGGCVSSGLAIYDTIQHIKSEVVTINIGIAASMGSLLLASGTKGKRFALPHSRTMIHQPMGGAQGQAEDIRVEANHILKTRENIFNIYCRMTGLSKEKIMNYLDRDKFMSATEAKNEGFIDHIITSKQISTTSIL